MITDEQWDNIFLKIMALPGMNTAHDSDFMAEPAGEDRTYIKFMSDGGITDACNGRELGMYLRANDCNIEQARDRSMIVSDADIVRLFL